VGPAGILHIADFTLQIHFPLATGNVKLETRIMSDFEPGCLFCRVIKGDAPSKKVYEDDRTYAFLDIRPQAPTHVLIVPKKHIRGLKEATTDHSELVGYCHVVAAKIAKERGIEDGYRTVLNVGPGAGQSVFHLHVHLLGGRHLGWPPG
jgi:histidine triad (HIT) family protein